VLSATRHDSQVAHLARWIRGGIGTFRR